MDKKEAISLLSDTENGDYYRTTPDTPHGCVELTEEGARIAESADLTIDVDAYGCAYVRELDDA